MVLARTCGRQYTALLREEGDATDEVSVLRALGPCRAPCPRAAASGAALGFWLRRSRPRSRGRGGAERLLCFHWRRRERARRHKTHATTPQMDVDDAEGCAHAPRAGDRHVMLACTGVGGYGGAWPAPGPR